MQLRLALRVDEDIAMKRASLRRAKKKQSTIVLQPTHKLF
jgi:hypothetical protein